MAWLRIEPYYDKEEVEFLPMLCQHCDNAPCEPVCPVFAAYHNPEGLNVQVYNRCVGTRYCSNNCPYKVRRFNWRQHAWPEPQQLMINPDVVARGVGVMEKCTFCFQRIRAAKDKAKDESRKVRDGEVTTACAQSCPTGAITFGDLLDRESRVYRLAHSGRAYRALESLGTEPSVHYLRSTKRGQGK
jgi:molybdopterin-containing oxidoreductase family iron-sulfur binding subunit